jgi:hypothetical protein
MDLPAKNYKQLVTDKTVRHQAIFRDVYDRNKKVGSRQLEDMPKVGEPVYLESGQYRIVEIVILPYVFSQDGTGWSRYIVYVQLDR